MESLLALGRYKEAEQAYRDASRLLEGGLGAVSLDQAMARYRQAPRRRAFGAESLVGLELGLSAEDTGAPYYCSYPSFQDAYRFIARLAERTGAKNLLLLCTLTEGTEETGKQLRPLEAPIGTGRIELWPGGEDGTSAGIKMRDTETDDLEEKMGWLKKVLVDQLRTGDFYTRYSQTQYLALLAEAKEEDGEGILDRLERAWEGYGQEGKTEAEFSLVEMDV